MVGVLSGRIMGYGALHLKEGECQSINGVSSVH